MRQCTCCIDQFLHLQSNQFQYLMDCWAMSCLSRWMPWLCTCTAFHHKQHHLDLSNHKQCISSYNQNEWQISLMKYIIACCSGNSKTLMTNCPPKGSVGWSLKQEAPFKPNLLPPCWWGWAAAGHRLAASHIAPYWKRISLQPQTCRLKVGSSHRSVLYDACWRWAHKL